MSSSIQKAKTIIVDNIQTRLEELSDALDQLYNVLDNELNSIGSLDEINTILIEGFMNVIENRPPFDVVAEENEEEEEGNDDDDDNDNDNENDSNLENNADCNNVVSKSKDIENIIKMINSW